MDSINTFDPSSLFSSDQLSNAVVQASGQITWFQQNVLTTICRMDITYFPFDSQLCNISVSMWTSSTSQVNTYLFLLYILIAIDIPDHYL